jgi:hypothetical protein
VVYGRISGDNDDFLPQNFTYSLVFKKQIKLESINNNYPLLQVEFILILQVRKQAK